MRTHKIVAIFVNALQVSGLGGLIFEEVQHGADTLGAQAVGWIGDVEGLLSGTKLGTELTLPYQVELLGQSLVSVL